MPITVLLIDNDPAHAQSLVTALADPWLGWRVEVASTVQAGRERLRQQGVDIVVCTRQVEDGTAFDVLETLQGIPALIVVRPGEEGHAAHAMRHGFADFAVQDAGLNYLLALPAQIEAILERSTSARARRTAEAMLARQHRLLQAISRAQAVFISNDQPQAAFETLLEELMELTRSSFGLVGHVQRTPAEPPALLVHALTDIRWDEMTRMRTVRRSHGALELCDPLSLVGAALASEQAVIVNDASTDPRCQRWPAGLPALQSCLCLPIHAAQEMVALVLLANCPNGYALADIQFPQPLLSTIGQLEMARRAQEERRNLDAELMRTSALLCEKSDALQATLASVAQGIVKVDADGRIRVYNQRYLELLELPEEFLSREPSHEDIVRYQTERGDFGMGFELIEAPARAYVQAEYAAQGRGHSIPETYVRRTQAGRYLEVRSRSMPDGGLVRTFTDVTDYLGTLEALRQSEARWRSLTDLSSDWYWEQDAQLRFVRLNGRPVEDLGLDAQAFYGRTLWELPNTFVSDTLWGEHRSQVQAHEVFQDFEMQRQGPDGQMVWVSVSGEPIFDQHGRFAGYRGVARDITQRKSSEAEIQRLAFYDELTGLPNRRLLMDRLERAVATCARDSTHGALLFLDLDNFKGINDTLGHEWGDRLLRQVAERISASVRASDTVARLGGDEFVLVLQGLHEEQTEAAVEAELVAQKVLQNLTRPYALEGAVLHSTPSIGITLFHDGGQSLQELLKRADLAMYQAKAQGRNTLCFFDPAMQAAATARSALEGDIRAGIERQEFMLHYQPVVNAQGQVLGAEALVRWRHPQRGMVPPGEFISLAEQTGLILPLGRQVLRMACAQLARWGQQATTSHWTVSVNVSAQEFKHPDFVAQVWQALKEAGASPQQLKIELTESLLLQDVEDSIAKMRALREQGVGFSLDDFGTGYSSLSYLKRLPLDQLKIDQSFVRDVLTDPNDAAIACTIVALAQSLGLDVVAEGVETEGQREFLLRNGCHRFQGYLFGRPGPAEQLQNATENIAANA
ncbi:EAL domain-containing protein [Acidovorax sp. DW039]|uniref:EAL domain-containing protein n=1 Tax=Acidovorax sp. DW039 TaxID=3095606 RepID=UPI00308EA2F4|nr:EAL domain-containing protein [Acidovorax sp. DW039]